jgi:hypothetical protein
MSGPTICRASTSREARRHTFSVAFTVVGSEATAIVIESELPPNMRMHLTKPRRRVSFDARLWTASLQVIRGR